MSSGTRIEPQFESREILLANVKFYNQDEIKIRPVIVISKFSTNRSHDHFICVAVSSQLQQNDPFRIDILDQSTEEGHFPKPSQVVCDNIFTIDKKDVIKRIGMVTIPFYGVITKTLKDKIIQI